MSDNINNQSVSGRSSHDNHPSYSTPLITHDPCLPSDSLESIGSIGSIASNNVMAKPGGTEIQPENSSSQGQQQQQDNKLVLYSPPRDTSFPSKPVQPPLQQVPMSLSSSSTSQNIGLPEADELELSLLAKISKKRKTLEAEKLVLQEQILSLERAAVEQREKYETQLATERAQAEEDRKHYQTWREKVEEQNGKLVIKGQLIESQNREIAELKASLKSLSDESEQRKLQINENYEQLHKAEQKFNANVEEFATFKNDSAETQRKLGGEISGLMEKVQKANQENAKLNSEISDLKQLSKCANVEFKRNVRELDDLVKMKQREIDTISNQQDSLQRQCKTLREEMTTKDGQISSLESERDDLKKQVGKLTGELKSKTELVQKIVDEEKKYRRESTIDRLLQQEEMSTTATTTLTISRPRRSIKRKCSPSSTIKNIPGQVPAASIVATADTTISSTGPKPRQKTRAK